MDTSQQPSLQSIRKSRKLTSTQASLLIASALGRPFYHFSSVLKAEKRGLCNIQLIRAYAKAYGCKAEEIEAASCSPHS